MYGYLQNTGIAAVPGNGEFNDAWLTEHVKVLPLSVRCTEWLKVDDTENISSPIGVGIAYWSDIADPFSSCHVKVIVAGLNPEDMHLAMLATVLPSVCVANKVTFGLDGRSVNASNNRDVTILNQTINA